MTKKNLALMIEWIRPVGIGFTVFFAYCLGEDEISRFHIMGLFVVMLMSGTVAFESLILGEVASEKIGYGKTRQTTSRWKKPTSVPNRSLQEAHCLPFESSLLGWLHPGQLVWMLMRYFHSVGGS
jgi:hypothetical protein